MADGFSDNKSKNRFEYHVGSHFALADYRRENGTLFIDFVEAPPELQGTGAAGKLMREIVNMAAHQGEKVVPICGYAASWIRKNSNAPKP